MILVMGPGILVRNQILVLILDFLDSNQKSEFETQPEAKKLNLVLSKESTAAKDVGTTVDKTTIPV